MEGYLDRSALLNLGGKSMRRRVMLVAAAVFAQTAGLLGFVSAQAAPVQPTLYVLSRSGSEYVATPSPGGTTYRGTSLKSVGESAVADLEATAGPGQTRTLQFTAGDFNLGTTFFKFENIHDLNFVGAGVDSTVLRNSTSVAADTEPFNVTGADRVSVRDMTVSAGGAARSTSDALDFDKGNFVTIERVKVSSSRAKGIIFDGKGTGWTADNNIVRDCTITGVPSHGIELLASNDNRIEGCNVTGVGGHGIYADKASTQAAQPNKKSNDNTIINNVVDESGQNGIAVNSGDRNVITGNTVTNSSNLVSSRDGIRIFSADSITCDDNSVLDNTAKDTQAVKTQKYGLNINSSLCNRTVVGSNNFAGNLTGPIRDVGTGTIYQSTPDTEKPSVPGNVSANADGAFAVDVSWSASTDNVGVTGYGVYRNDVLLSQVGGATLTYRDQAVAPSTTYSYRIDAVDAANNRSARSDPATVTTGPAGTQVTLNPTADSYVNADSPTTNYGSSTQLRVDGSPVVKSYLRFSVPAVTVASAKLRIFANSASSTGIEARGTAGGWQEGTITSNNAPAVGSVVGSSGSFGAGAYVEVDVTSAVTGGGEVNLALTGPGSTAISMSSRDGANKPQLVVATAN
jgi:parallel beta-helix repeat protein